MDSECLNLPAWRYNFPIGLDIMIATGKTDKPLLIDRSWFAAARG